MIDGMLTLHTLRRGVEPAAGGAAALPLVLLHAFPLDHRMWADVVDLLPGDRTVLAPDLPGFGVSPSGPDVARRHPTLEAPSVDVMAEAVAAALLARGVTRAVVAGLSMGGYVAMALAERRPDLLAGLALLDTKATADTDEARANRLAVAERVTAEQTVEAVRGMATTLIGATSLRTRADLVGVVDRWIVDQGPAGVAWAQRAMAARPDRTGALRAYPGPALVVVGAQDALTPPEQARLMVQALPDAAYLEVPDAGHLTVVENPEPVAAALSDLLHRAGRSGPAVGGP